DVDAAVHARPGPRWSKEGLPALIAGLPGNNACVKVGPPLFRNGPSIGLVLILSPGPVRTPPPLSVARLYPREWTVPPLLRIVPPPNQAPASRTVSPIVTCPELNIPPPSWLMLPLRVLFVIVSVPLPPTKIPPPSPLRHGSPTPPSSIAELLLMVLFTTVNAPLA